MKKLAIAALLFALLMGIEESDCGAFIIYVLLFVPIFIQKKKENTTNDKV